MAALIKLFFCILYSDFIRNRTCRNWGKHQLLHRYIEGTQILTCASVTGVQTETASKSNMMTKGAGLPKYWPIYAEKTPLVTDSMATLHLYPICINKSMLRVVMLLHNFTSKAVMCLKHFYCTYISCMLETFDCPALNLMWYHPQSKW